MFRMCFSVDCRLLLRYPSVRFSRNFPVHVSFSLRSLLCVASRSHRFITIEQASFGHCFVPMQFDPHSIAAPMKREPRKTNKNKQFYIPLNWPIQNDKNQWIFNVLISRCSWRLHRLSKRFTMCEILFWFDWQSIAFDPSQRSENCRKRKLNLCQCNVDDAQYVVVRLPLRLAEPNGLKSASQRPYTSGTNISGHRQQHFILQYIAVYQNIQTFFSQFFPLCAVFTRLFFLRRFVRTDRESRRTAFSTLRFVAFDSAWVRVAGWLLVSQLISNTHCCCIYGCRWADNGVAEQCGAVWRQLREFTSTSLHTSVGVCLCVISCAKHIDAATPHWLAADGTMHLMKWLPETSRQWRRRYYAFVYVYAQKCINRRGKNDREMHPTLTHIHKRI